MIPRGHFCNIPVRAEADYEGNAFVETSLRLKEGEEHCILGIVLRISKETDSYIPVIKGMGG